MMNTYIEFLKQISSPRKDFDAQGVIFPVIDAEIQRIRHMSHHGYFHEYVKIHGYPIPTSVMSDAPHHERLALQNKLKSAIEACRNVILLGCEGSGKTTLIHRVVGGEISARSDCFFIYVDVSDIDVKIGADYTDVIHGKIISALIRNASPQDQDSFANWVANNKNSSVFAAPLFDLRSKINFIELFFCFLRTRSKDFPSYVILDNIDSASLEAAKTLFNTLSLINDGIRAICKTLKLHDNENVRYIISCRTPTYAHVSGHSQGLCIDFPFHTIPVDDDFVSNTSVLELMQSYLAFSDSQDDGGGQKTPITIQYGTFTQTLSFHQYAQDVIKWIKQNEAVFNETIKMFCGRSIRRATLFGLKVLACPTIARLTMLEKYEVVNITRTGKSYLKRRLREAIFDFSSSSRLQGLGLIGFPMNPFRVVSEQSEFRDNPLIGVVGLDYLRVNEKEMIQKDIFFAKAIDIRALVTEFRKIGYTDVAIKDFFCCCRDCGLLRPILSSDIFMDDHTEHRHVHQMYVIDQRARDSYHDLVFCRDFRVSLTFYNCAVRAHYEISADYYIDNILYEAFSGLVFISDIMWREEQLRNKMKNSGVLFETLSSRVRSSFIPFISNLIQQSKDQQDTSRSTTKVSNKQIYDKAELLLSDVRDRIGKLSSII